MDNRTAAQGGRMRPQTFGDAFREARLAGDKTFEFNGKTYTTKTAEEQGREIGARAAAGSGRGASAGRTAADRDTASLRSEAATEKPSSAARPRASLSDVPGLIARGMAEGADRVPAGRGLGAAFTAAGAARGAGAAAQGALARREAASAAAEAERLASRVEPRMRRSGESVEESAKQARAEMAREPRMRRSGESVDESVSQARAEMAREPRMRRSGEGVEEATKQARMDMAREPRLEPARALSAAERKPPAVQGDKAGMTPRSRTRETDEGVEFKKGGKVKAYAKGGSVKGSGCEQRGLRKCKVY